MWGFGEEREGEFGGGEEREAGGGGEGERGKGIESCRSSSHGEGEVRRGVK